MKLKEYAAKIAKLAKKYPTATVIYSSDDEGNEFAHVNFEPSAGNYFGGNRFGDFDKEGKINAVCVN